MLLVVLYVYCSRALTEATDVWGRVTELEFRETVPEYKDADFRIVFGAEDHGDPWPFDGFGWLENVLR